MKESVDDRLRDQIFSKKIRRKQMLADDFVTMEIGKTKHIALVAHDGKK